MATILLIFIYIFYIGLGIPDSLRRRCRRKPFPDGTGKRNAGRC